MHHLMPSTDFWDRIAAKYAAQPIADPAAYEEKLARLRSLVGPTDRVLEVGCGTGGTALRIAPFVAHVTATDVSAAMVEIAESKLGPGAPKNVEFRQSSVDDDVPGAPFDVVCAFSLLHLVDDLPSALGRISDHLKPSGLFISKTVCLPDISWVMPAVVRVMTWFGKAPPVLSLTRSNLVAAIEAAGFAVEDVTHFGKHSASPFIVARRRQASAD